MVIATFSKCIVKVPETVSFRSYHKLKAILACSSKVQLLHNHAVCSKSTPETYLHNRQHVHKYFSPPTAQPGVCPGQDTWPKPSRVLHSGTAWGTRMELGHFLSDPSRNLLLLLNKQKLPWPRGGNTSHTCQNKNKDDSNASIISHFKRKKKDLFSVFSMERIEESLLLTFSLITWSIVKQLQLSHMCYIAILFTGQYCIVQYSTVLTRPEISF